MARLIPVVSLALVFLAGCQTKLKDERKFTLGPGDSHRIMIDGPKYDQKVTIVLTTDAPVDVDVFLKKDMVNDVKPKTTLGSFTQSSGGQLDVQIPAKQEFIIEVGNARKQANCTVKTAGN